MLWRRYCAVGLTMTFNTGFSHEETRGIYDISDSLNSRSRNAKLRIENARRNSHELQTANHMIEYRSGNAKPSILFTFEDEPDIEFASKVLDLL